MMIFEKHLGILDEEGQYFLCGVKYMNLTL